MSRGALAALAVLVPTVLAVRASTGPESSADLLVVVAFFAGFLACGVVAGRRGRHAPLTNAAAAAALAYVLAVGTAVAIRLLRGRGLSAALVSTVILFSTLAVSLALLGALLGRRRRRA